MRFPLRPFIFGVGNVVLLGVMMDLLGGWKIETDAGVGCRCQDRNGSFMVETTAWEERKAR